MQRSTHPLEEKLKSVEYMIDNNNDNNNIDDDDIDD